MDMYAVVAVGNDGSGGIVVVGIVVRGIVVRGGTRRYSVL